MKARVRNVLSGNAVTLLFVILCIGSILCSGQPLGYIVKETVARISRNAVLILSLILPVLCGMGLNFSIVVGAMAGEIALVMITHWNIGGAPGMLLAAVIASILGGLFGLAVGKLMNRAVGQEMITGIILGYFSIGLFDLTFLILLGRVIPFQDAELMLSNGVGLKNTIAFHDDVKNYLDHIWRITLDWSLIYAALTAVAVLAVLVLRKKKRCGGTLLEAVKGSRKSAAAAVVLTVSAALVWLIPPLHSACAATQIPMVVGLIIALLCLLTAFISRTKIGQDIRTTGQNMDVAIVSGINVGRCRLFSITFSTIIAALGQVIYLQNMGNMNTFSSHEQVGQYAIAALLVGGASIKKASIGHVFLGAALFHILFFTSPLAGNQLFGDAQIGEYFRVFVGYAVITISLVLYGLKQAADKRLSLIHI